MNNNALLEKLDTLINPIVTGLEYELYHIEYVKEQGENYLRVYIDKESGISLEDCEKVSRRISEMLDEKDPIEDSYYLEVSSPGIERILYTDEHLSKYTNENVFVKLSKLFNGSKKIEGKLVGFDNEFIKINVNEEEVTIPKEKIKRIILKGEF